MDVCSEPLPDLAPSRRRRTGRGCHLDDETAPDLATQARREDARGSRHDACRGHDEGPDGGAPQAGVGAAHDELLVVDDLKKHFPVTRGIIFQKRGRRGEGGRRRLLHGATRARRSASSASPGCGKSTLARCIVRLLEPTGGTDRASTGSDITQLERARDAPAPARAADGLPGPVRLAEPAQARRRRSSREPLEVHRHRHAGARCKRRVQELLEVVGLNPEHYNRYPARVLRRPAPAHRHRPRARPQPEADRLRRAGLRARRLGPGADPQPARRTCSSDFGLTYVFIAHDLASCGTSPTA